MRIKNFKKYQSRNFFLKSVVLFLIAFGTHIPCAGQPSESEKRILMQGFYWDCYNETGKGLWWNFLASKTSALAAAGITEMWLPVSSKGSSGGFSMGYDPYDYYDLGNFDQRGSIKTGFGSRAELQSLISVMHINGLKAYADLVFNHNFGGANEINPHTGDQAATSYVPLSGKYQFHYDNFHPCTFESKDEDVFSNFPDLCHANPTTMSVLVNYKKWLKDSIGYDGWRYDWVNGYHPWVIDTLQRKVSGFGVVELWDSKAGVMQYLSNIHYNASVFDLHLFYALKSMCNSVDGSYNMKNLWGSGLVDSLPANAVTIVQNHDLDKEAQYQIINTDKMLAYAVILTRDGLPMIFWRDYFNYNLAKSGKPNGIDQLLWVRKNLATGKPTLLYADTNLYVMQRNGNPGLIVEINNHPTVTKTANILSKWKSAVLKPYAYGSSVINKTPLCLTTSINGNVDISVPPRGYIVYAPDDGTDFPVKCDKSSAIRLHAVHTDSANISIKSLNGIIMVDLREYLGGPFYLNIMDSRGVSFLKEAAMPRTIHRISMKHLPKGIYHLSIEGTSLKGNKQILNTMDLKL